MKRAAKIAIGAGASALAAVIGLAAFVYSGIYDISATDQHTKPVYWLMEFTMRRSIAVRASERDTPDLSKVDTMGRGFALYHESCAQCHGGPGLSPAPAALGLTPVPAYLVPTGREWSAGELHWVIKNGIKMTGMPAWKHRMTDEEIWQVVGFLKERLPYLTTTQYREAAAKLPAPTERAETSDGAAPSQAAGNPYAGRRAIDQYACATCHIIPGVTGATRQVGPPLSGMASRSYIAGVLANTQPNMVRWIMSPTRVSANTAMPDLGVSERDARDIAAYLATLKGE